MDETTQMARITIDSTRYVIKGSVELIKLVAMMIKKVGIKIASAPGAHSFKDILTSSDGKAPIVTYIPTKLGIIDTQVLEGLKSSGIPYCILPDLNPLDHKYPIAIPPQYADAANAVIETYYSENIKNLKDKNRKYTEKTEDCKNAIEQAKDETEKQKNELLISSLNRAKEENTLLIKEWSEAGEKGYSVLMEDWIKEGKETGSEYIKNPSLAFDKEAAGITQPPILPAKECFKVVREPDLVDFNNKMFYMAARDGLGTVVINREFHRDIDGLSYSIYSFITPEGEYAIFDDRGINTENGVTVEDFENNILPKLYEKACITEDTPMYCFNGADMYRAFTEKNKKVEEEYIEKMQDKAIEIKMKDPKLDEWIIKKIEEETKTRIDDSLINFYEITISEDDLITVDNQLGVETLEGTLIISEDELVQHEDRLILKLDKRKEYSLITPDKEEKTINAYDIKEMADNADIKEDLPKETAVKSVSKAHR